MLPKSALRSPDQAADFARDGYVVVPFLGADEVERLRAVYTRHHATDEDIRRQTIPSYSPGFYASTFNNDLAYRQAVSEAVIDVCRPALERVFEDFRVFFAGFLVKLPDAAGRLRVHQDPTLVDESRFTPINVWCPLQDVDEQNGALRMLPGSHLLYRGPRATSIPPPWKGLEPFIESRMVSVRLRAGSAVLFTQATLHASLPNVSADPRLAATMFVCNREASIQIAHRNKATPDRIDLYEQDDDFMFRNAQFSTNSTGTPQIGRAIGSLPYEGATVTEERITQLVSR